MSLLPSTQDLEQDYYGLTDKEIRAKYGFNVSIWSSIDELKEAIKLIESNPIKQRRYRYFKGQLNIRQWNSAQTYLKPEYKVSPRKISKKRQEKINKIKKKRKKPVRQSTKKLYGDYETYLKSSSWKELRREVIERFGRRCATCNIKPKQGHVHHRTYSKIHTSDEIKDLIYLCNDCHDIIHRHRKIDGKIRGRNLEVKGE